VRFLLNQNGLDSTHYIKQTLPLTKALLIASINLSSSMEIRFFACSGVVDHTNELKFSVNLTWIKIKNLVNYIVSRDSNHTVKQTIVGFGCCVLYTSANKSLINKITFMKVSNVFSTVVLIEDTVNK